MVLVSQEADQNRPKYVALHRYSAGHGRGASQEWTDVFSTDWTKSLMGEIAKHGKSERSEWLYVAT